MYVYLLPNALVECATIKTIDESKSFFYSTKILFLKIVLFRIKRVVLGGPQMANLFSPLVCFRNCRHSPKESVDIHCHEKLNAVYY